jgi:hypothetical protein
MAIFSAAELEDLADLQEESFIDSADIVRDSRVSNNAGGHVLTPVPVASAVPCRVSPMSLTRAEAITGRKFTDTLPWQISLPKESDVRNQDRLTVGGVTYEVLTIWGPGTYQTVTKAICVKRQ